MIFFPPHPFFQNDIYSSNDRENFPFLYTPLDVCITYLPMKKKKDIKKIVVSRFEILEKNKNAGCH